MKLKRRYTVTPTALIVCLAGRTAVKGHWTKTKEVGDGGVRVSVRISLA